MSKLKLGFGMKKTNMTFLEPINDKKEDFRKVTYSVWSSSVGSHWNQPSDFVWPEYNTDKERLRVMKNLVKDLTIAEAFSKFSNTPLDLKEEDSEKVNFIPSNPKVGDLLNVNITHISKDDVGFNCTNLKQAITSKVNLYKYKKFQEFLPTNKIKVKVVQSSLNQITVDPIAPMIDEWISPILKNPNIQKNMENPQSIVVKDLKLTRGGFLGKAVIPNVSEWVGEPYTIDAFIPGSQIVLNIENDFEKWNGQTVNAFVTNYISKTDYNTGKEKMSLICSVKDYLKFQGDQNMIKLFDIWCDSDENWDKISKTNLEGRITGVINSSKKCGVFVEIPEMYITGFVNSTPSELVNYKPNTKVQVRLIDIEENVIYDDAYGQLQHKDAYVINNGILEKCLLKPVLKFV